MAGFSFDTIRITWTEPPSAVGILLQCADCGMTSSASSDERDADRIVICLRAVLSFAQTFAASHEAGCQGCRKEVATALRSAYCHSIITKPNQLRASTLGRVWGSPGICVHCKRPMGSLVSRGLCLTCWRKGPEVISLYPRRRSGRKPQWMLNGGPDLPALKERRKRERSEKKAASAALRRPLLSVTEICKTEIRCAGEDPLLALALEVAESVTPFKTEQYVGPAWEGIKEASLAGVTDRDSLILAARKSIKQHWNNELDHAQSSLEEMGESFGYEAAIEDAEN